MTALRKLPRQRPSTVQNDNHQNVTKVVTVQTFYRNPPRVKAPEADQRTHPIAPSGVIREARPAVSPSEHSKIGGKLRDYGLRRGCPGRHAGDLAPLRH